MMGNILELEGVKCKNTWLVDRRCKIYLSRVHLQIRYSCKIGEWMSRTVRAVAGGSCVYECP